MLYLFIEYRLILPTRGMHTLILNMRVLPPFGVNNPASLLPFLCDRLYDTKNEYVRNMIPVKDDGEDTSLIEDHVCLVMESLFIRNTFDKKMYL